MQLEVNTGEGEEDQVEKKKEEELEESSLMELSLNAVSGRNGPRVIRLDGVH